MYVYFILIVQLLSFLYLNEFVAVFRKLNDQFAHRIFKLCEIIYLCDVIFKIFDVIFKIVNRKRLGNTVSYC